MHSLTIYNSLTNTRGFHLLQEVVTGKKLETIHGLALHTHTMLTSSYIGKTMVLHYMGSLSIGQKERKQISIS